MICPWILKRGMEVYPIKFTDEKDAKQYKKRKKLHGFIPKFNLTLKEVRSRVDSISEVNYA